MQAKICNFPSCNKLINPSEKYCDKHIKPKVKPFENAVRYNEGLYNTAKWRKLRKQILNDCPYCVKCRISKNDTILEIHHIMPPKGIEALFFDISNCIPLCRQCHRVATGKETAIYNKG